MFCATPSSMLPPWMPKNHITLFMNRYSNPLPKVAEAKGNRALTPEKNSASTLSTPNNIEIVTFTQANSAATTPMGTSAVTAWSNTPSMLSP